MNVRWYLINFDSKGPKSLGPLLTKPVMYTITTKIFRILTAQPTSFTFNKDTTPFTAGLSVTSVSQFNSSKRGVNSSMTRAKSNFRVYLRWKPQICFRPCSGWGFLCIFSIPVDSNFCKNVQLYWDKDMRRTKRNKSIESTLKQFYNRFYFNFYLEFWQHLISWQFLSKTFVMKIASFSFDDKKSQSLNSWSKRFNWLHDAERLQK